MNVISYKCPSCDGPLKFKSESQEMGCEYCDSSFSIDEVKKYNDEENSSTTGDLGSDEYKNIRAYVCPSCSAEIIADETTSATVCPYCDNTTVLKKQLEGSFRPDIIIPFKINKKKAINTLKFHYKGKPLLPKAFCSENKIKEVKGMYVPFWLFDCRVDANITYKGQRVKMWSDGDYNYTKTDHYRLIRSGEVDFIKVPVDGASKIDNTLMEAIEPFNYNEAEEFTTAYLSGYLAEKYDVSEEDSTQRIKQRIQNSTEAIFENTTSGYSSVRVESSDIKLRKKDAIYALFPVWLLNTSYKGKNYTFVMNGQTGKFIGNLPVSRKRFWGWFAGLTAAISIGCFLIALMWAQGGLI